MNEAEWLASTDPAPMLRLLFGERGPTWEPFQATRPTDRKLRLCACACCRQPEVWDKLEDPRSCRAVEVAERYADGEATGKEVTAAHFPAFPEELSGANAHDPKWLAVWVSTTREGGMFEHNFSLRLETVTRCGVPPATQAALLRCIVGNPWRPAQSPPEWLRYARPAWLTPTVRDLARTIYDDRRWGDLGILADALEEADCLGEECSECLGYGKRWRCAACRGQWLLPGGEGPNTCPACPGRPTKPVACPVCIGAGIQNPLLAHLRSPGPHARGCWALDLLLGKE